MAIKFGRSQQSLKYLWVICSYSINNVSNTTAAVTRFPLGFLCICIFVTLNIYRSPFKM